MGKTRSGSKTSQRQTKYTSRPSSVAPTFRRSHPAGRSDRSAQPRRLRTARPSRHGGPRCGAPDTAPRGSRSRPNDTLMATTVMSTRGILSFLAAPKEPVATAVRWSVTPVERAPPTVRDGEHTETGRQLDEVDGERAASCSSARASRAPGPASSAPVVGSRAARRAPSKLRAPSARCVTCRARRRSCARRGRAG